MTTGLKTPSSYYIELINQFPPRPITDEIGLIATQNRIHVILDKPDLTQDDRDYLKVLGMLVYDYEEQHEPMPTLTGIPLLKALMEESNFQPKDLVAIFGSETTVLEVLNDKVQLSDRQIQELASVFHISPAALSPS